ncbi:MAG: type II toxin-antitoxin system VapC family toxin [Bacteroidota bacterium]
MIITVDTSCVLAVAAGEPTRDKLMESTRGAELIAPASLPAEIGNALSAMFKRGRISAAEAGKVLRAFQAIPIRLVALDLTRAVALAEQLNVYAYDAYVLDCARSEATPLLSLDKGQRAAATRVGIHLQPY